MRMTLLRHWIGIACWMVLNGARGGERAWDFNLPALDGSRFVRASSVQGPLLVNFWGVECPPCVEVRLTDHGGHVGYLGSDGAGGYCWGEQVVVGWLGGGVVG